MFNKIHEKYLKICFGTEHLNGKCTIIEEQLLSFIKLFKEFKLALLLLRFSQNQGSILLGQRQ